MDQNLTLYRKRLDRAPDPSETSAASEYQNCRSYVARINDASDHDSDAYPDTDSRPNFKWEVTELHGPRLELVVPHAEIPDFTLRWPDADITFHRVREPLPDKYYDDHGDENLNHYTAFTLDFRPYDEDPESEARSDPDADDDTDNGETIGSKLRKYATHPFSASEYFYGA